MIACTSERENGKFKLLRIVVENLISSEIVLVSNFCLVFIVIRIGKRKEKSN